MPKKKKIKKEKVEEEPKNGQVPEAEEEIAKKTEALEEAEPVDEEVQEESSIEDELKDLQDRHLRLRAEFDNYKKRKDREFIRLLQYEGKDVIISFLGIADDLQRMIASADGDKSKNAKSLVAGMNLILEKLHRRLSALKVEPFDSEGVKFDPELHDAMMTQTSDDHEDGVVIQEFEKGYKYKDRVIRHAKVIVNSKGSDKE
ncbi:MAG TPA: nucleotide exchange factor GrpE [Candidatus Marinimicrobia bacterium]|jgi:molecular chaperone GrpE|nr:nucleotide exchange factor GrpE [Candidatus Neomarinimicrobiota bacterium]HIB03595.1 nucleotide exchange factor GrpE [Candidatus Neomarinimicrobiota bacterium]HIB72164.1 nucleotide exchange factor GrpE [Candidatus Neomarinimicrobiota bacterium]HIB95640.1 nucleotide exchange factor GrpE [Candidatus Neomarinimicrobiota bacterium]HIC73972.1 nucleotide exchange factor GrpE [Candidatus Neomarinimicrobiota bacterium]